ncbi:metallophosphoesterase [Gayadomonas joobiniege]|uniref:metallophosphoesterase n=1 Tax=Gayadomonas joobiniege TaxID=1234606 RepID=UPI000380E52A|nr:metallophosphoesterase [Gayadomonas joobiniege]
MQLEKHLEKVQDKLPLSQLPLTSQAWLDGKKFAIRKRKANHHVSKKAVKSLLSGARWQWPKREIIFITDLHADADALRHSLALSGGVRLTGKNSQQLELTEFGQKALFVFGGDFFDKGPSNLALLETLYKLIKLGAKVRLLAGNHDIRVLFGMRCVGQTDDPRNGHFFIRMGAKAVPFLKEIYDKYISSADLKKIPDSDYCQSQLYPSEVWWQNFADLAGWVMPKVAIEREVKKIEKKTERFAAVCADAGLDIRQAYAAAIKWQALFLQPDGEFSWFFKRLKLAYKSGSFLYVHAGLDDRMAAMLNEHSISHINKQFQSALKASPFEFYYGPIANTIRTKYRVVDMPLTQIGTEHAHKAGIYAIMHGHRNLHHGQRIAVRKGLLHFECDVTLDINSRQKEGLKGLGAGVTLISPKQYIAGISTDYPKIKFFQPDRITNNGKR